MSGLRTLLAALVAALALLAVAPAAHAGPVPKLRVGIADQKPSTFTDPAFLALRLRDARLVVPWDVLIAQRWQREELDAWMDAAEAAGMRPLVTFGHSRRPAWRRHAPSPKTLQTQFNKLRSRYPFVAAWAAWNEPNHCGEPLCNKPKLAARYHDALRRACPTCTILAAEVLDMPNMRSWVRAFTKATTIKPRWWGLHNYIDANRFRTSGTRTLLKETTGEVWFTETGGLVRRADRKGKVHFDESPAHAARAVRWLFDRLVRLDRKRVTRVYLYHWSSSSPNDSWDSAFIDASGRQRPALDVLRSKLRGLRAARRVAR